MPIGGIDNNEGKNLEEGRKFPNDSENQNVKVRFRNMAHGVLVEADQLSQHIRLTS